MNNIKTIGFYDDSINPGGTTRYMLEILNNIDRSKFEPVFFASEIRPWHLVFNDIGVKTIYSSPNMAFQANIIHDSSSISSPSQNKSIRWWKQIVPRSILWTLGNIREVRKLESLFRSKYVHLLHSNHAGAEVAPIAAKRAGIPRIIATWHVDPSYDLEGERLALRYRYLEKLSMNSTDHSIAVSQATRASWIERCKLNKEYQSRTSVIYNGVDTSDIIPLNTKEKAKALFDISDNRLAIGSLGRLEKAKGFEYLIKSLPQIVSQIPETLVVIAGDGPLKSDLVDLAKTFGVENNIRFLGYVKDVRAVLECLDIYVQPSLCEAHPFGTLEAGAMGLPIVASAVGGIPETVVDGETGFIVPARDPQQLAEKLILLGKNASVRNAMAEKGRERIVQHFSSKRMIEETLEVYEKLLSSDTKR